jgi:sucrose phosphorylase
VVQRLLALIRLRNAHPAFGGTFEVRSSEDDSLHLRWQQGGQWLELRAHLPSHQWQLHGEGGAVQV